MQNADKSPYLPVFFRRNRVFRVYRGGKLFHELLGDPAEDGNMPEEWICSSVRAINPGRTDPLEGISLREEDGKPFSELIAENKEAYLGERDDVGVLVKYLDSAVRLPMQAHPTRAYSEKHFNSTYGKAEAWLVLATRPGACIYFGFDRRVSKEEFSLAVDKSETDKEIMTSFVNRVPVKSGDVFFVGAGVIHAIGAGCLILEVQEPTDFTIQPEHWCADYKLNDREMYLGLDKETALECFDFEKYGAAALESGRKEPKVLSNSGGVLAEELIGQSETPCFSMNRFSIEKAQMTLAAPASVWICVEGEGKVISDGYDRKIGAGEYFFLPAAAAGKCAVSTGGKIKMVCCKGGN